MLLALTAIASLSLGYDLSLLVWRRDRDQLSWAERALYASLIGVTLWLASAWVLAFADLLTRPAMLGRTLLFAAVAIALRWRAGGFGDLASRELEPKTVYLVGLPLLPLFLWCIFVLWRSFVVPPLSHDALAGHLPKAALWVQEQGYDRLDEWSALIGPRPSSYEMMLADAILLDGDDTYTEWLSTLFYLLFILASVAMTHRWWGDDIVTSVSMALLIGGVPVALLQSGAHKNDLMTAFFMVGGAVAAGRWLTTADLRAVVLAGVASAAAAGTKQHGSVLAICLAPFLIPTLFRVRWNVGRVAAVVLIAALSIALLGAGPFVFDRGTQTAPSAPPPNAAAPQPEARYGDWANLWIGPWALVTAPFSYGRALFVPGYGSWFWRRYEIYFSHLGLPFAIAAVLLVFGFLRCRRSGPPETQRERVIVTVAALIAFFAILPITGRPFGMFMMTLPRFVLFLVPVILNWTLIPLIRELSRRGLARVALAAVALVFTAYAIENAANDTFVPPSYVAFARQNPGTRVVPFSPHRPASVVDRLAGPRDVIAIDGGPSTWVYPAFGPKLTRRVLFVSNPAGGSARIPDAAKWVVVDRSWTVIWGDQRFRSLSDTGKYLARGEPSPEDIQALMRVGRDPRYLTVYVNPRSLQGLFVRRDAVRMPKGTPPASAPHSGAR